MGCCARRAKTFPCTVVLLDETEITEDIQVTTKGEFLLERVFSHLNLVEKAYFGLRFLNKAGESRWLDPLHRVAKQLKGLSPFTVYFGVKFYASDPCRLLEEITRYQFVLQLKQDIAQGRLPLTDDLAAELFALSLQGELGDFDPRKHHEHYVSEFRFLPDQNPQLEKRVEQIHKTLVGRVPSTVEMSFLERVRWLDMYGVDLHPVLGEEHIEYFLGLTPSGVLVIKGKNILHHYFWPRMSKVFFKGKSFMIRIKDKTNDETTYVFLVSSREACEYLWKCCVEHHAFFRLTQVKDVSNSPLQIFRLGSKYRYSGRTEQQVRSETVRRPAPPILRVPSRRFQKRSSDVDIQAKEESKKIVEAKDDFYLSRTEPLLNPLYRSVSTPAALSSSLSLQSVATDLAPWEDPNQRGGLFGSRRSRRSSSTDSANRRAHRNRRSSDNESEVSRSSRDSRSSRRRGRESGSESDWQHHRSSRQRKRSHRRSEYRLVESESQWRKVQEQRKEQDSALQSAVVRDLSGRKSGYMNSGLDTESEATTRHRKKYRRRSRSGSQSPEALPREVKKLLRYQLEDSSHLTEEEKRQIRYTRVESEKEIFRLHYSPSSGRLRRRKVSPASSRNSLEFPSRNRHT
ncbi:band 4.1-like protein 4 [Trichonephila clavata]|uniref:Band 4.1-like protein 4 n=1 Tax=Trichonephila clavata TaxID=2740835 RepID=A0A8X6FRW3_TRICU|nr:band 4.1-like protein 4 [Trichonephila clavata]